MENGNQMEDLLASSDNEEEGNDEVPTQDGGNVPPMAAILTQTQDRPTLSQECVPLFGNMAQSQGLPLQQCMPMQFLPQLLQPAFLHPNCGKAPNAFASLEQMLHTQTQAQMMQPPVFPQQDKPPMALQEGQNKKEKAPKKKKGQWKQKPAKKKNPTRAGGGPAFQDNKCFFCWILWKKRTLLAQQNGSY